MCRSHKHLVASERWMLFSEVCVHFVSQCVFLARVKLNIHEEKMLCKTLSFTRRLYRGLKHVSTDIGIKKVIQGTTTSLHERREKILSLCALSRTASLELHSFCQQEQLFFFGRSGLISSTCLMWWGLIWLWIYILINLQGNLRMNQ